jgi:hypothetical protein
MLFVVRCGLLYMRRGMCVTGNFLVVPLFLIQSGHDSKTEFFCALVPVIVIIHIFMF